MPICFLLLLGLATVVDLHQRRIPNGIPACLIVLTVVILLFASDLSVSPGWGASVAGLAAGLVLMLPGYVLGAMGAGDVKLMAASGFAFGWPLALPLVFATMIGMGLWALAALIFGAQGRQPAGPAIALGGLVAVVLHAH